VTRESEPPGCDEAGETNEAGAARFVVAALIIPEDSKKSTGGARPLVGSLPAENLLNGRGQTICGTLPIAAISP